jgi:hypothetical protein
MKIPSKRKDQEPTEKGQEREFRFVRSDEKGAKKGQKQPSSLDYYSTLMLHSPRLIMYVGDH